jgi:hypothetical protein
MDQLYVCNPRSICVECNNIKGARKKCETCKRTGYQRINLSGSWAPQPGFLVCGGPSLQEVPIDCLQERGVMSLGVNNAAAYARTSAAVFGDPQWKFHSSLFFDPKCLVFAPNGKLCRNVRMQDSETKEFWFSDKKLAMCPNVYGFCRSGKFYGESFFSDWFAHWGMGGKQGEEREFTRLATMMMGIRLLQYLGCSTIYMLGVDFWMTKETPYAWGGNRTSGNRIWWKIDKMLTEVRVAAEKIGVTILNCNPQSKCESFEFADFSDAMVHATRPFGHDPYDLSRWYERGTMKEHRELHPKPVSDYIV